MTTSEKFSLKSNDFQESASTVFIYLRKDIDFSEVTLVCEDCHQIEAAEKSVVLHIGRKSDSNPLQN